MGIIQKPAGPKDQTWATISSLWFGQLSPITCELNLCGQLWEFIAIAIKEDKAEHERDHKRTSTCKKVRPKRDLAPFPLLSQYKIQPNLNEARTAQGILVKVWGRWGSVAFEWSNKHKRRQKCHFSRLPSKGSFEWISLVVGQHFKVLSGLLLKWLNAFRGLFVYVHVSGTPSYISLFFF